MPFFIPQGLSAACAILQVPGRQVDYLNFLVTIFHISLCFSSPAGPSKSCSLLSPNTQILFHTCWESHCLGFLNCPTWLYLSVVPLELWGRKEPWNCPSCASSALTPSGTTSLHGFPQFTQPHLETSWISSLTAPQLYFYNA